MGRRNRGGVYRPKHRLGDAPPYLAALYLLDVGRTDDALAEVVPILRQRGNRDRIRQAVAVLTLSIGDQP